MTVESFPGAASQVAGPLPGLEVQRAAGLTVAPSTWTALGWDAVTTRGAAPLIPLWVAANPTRLYADRDGWWSLSASNSWPPGATGTFRGIGAANSAAALIGTSYVTPSGGYLVTLYNRVIWMTAGDWIEVRVAHDYTSAINTNPGSNNCSASWQPIQGVKGDTGASGPPGAVGSAIVSAWTGFTGTYDATKPLLLFSGSNVIVGNGGTAYTITHNLGLTFVHNLFVSTGSANGFGAGAGTDDSPVTNNAFSFHTYATIANGFSVRFNWMVIGQR